MLGNSVAVTVLLSASCLAACTEREVAMETTTRGLTFRETLGVQDRKSFGVGQC